MATVRLSEELKTTIRNRAFGAFDIANSEPELADDLRQMIADNLVNCDQQADLKKLIKQSEDFNDKHMGFLKSQDAIISSEKQDITTVKLMFTQSDGDCTLDCLCVDIPKIQLLGPYALSYDTKITVEQLPDTTQLTLLPALRTLWEQRKDRQEKSEAYKGQIRALIERCNTLKQLLDVWPAVKGFVPQYALDKMFAKVERSQTRAQSLKDELGFDASLANQVAVTAKLKGAGS